jgi:hypothetical protein
MSGKTVNKPKTTLARTSRHIEDIATSMISTKLLRETARLAGPWLVRPPRGRMIFAGASTPRVQRRCGCDLAAGFSDGRINPPHSAGGRLALLESMSMKTLII